MSLSDSGRRALVFAVAHLREGLSGTVVLTCSGGGVRSVRVRRRILRGDAPDELDPETKAYLSTAADVLRDGFSGDLFFECEAGAIVDVYEEIVSRPKDIPDRRELSEAVG